MIHVAGLHLQDFYRYKHQLQEAACPVTLYARVRRRKGALGKKKEDLVCSGVPRHGRSASFRTPMTLLL